MKKTQSKLRFEICGKPIGEDIFHNDNFTSIFHFFAWLPIQFWKGYLSLDFGIIHCFYAPAYGNYISQLMRYVRTCSFYLDFLQRHRFLSNKLLIQGFLHNRLIVSFKQLFGRYQRLDEKYYVTSIQMAIE